MASLFFLLFLAIFERTASFFALAVSGLCCFSLSGLFLVAFYFALAILIYLFRRLKRLHPLPKLFRGFFLGLVASLPLFLRN